VEKDDKFQEKDKKIKDFLFLQKLTKFRAFSFFIIYYQVYY